MKKHNYHFLLISLIIFLFFLSSTILVTAAAPEPPCAHEGGYCDEGGPICCAPFSCIEHICGGSSDCVEEAGDCNVDGDCCDPATCRYYDSIDDKRCCPSYRPYWNSGGWCSDSEECSEDGDLKSSSEGNICCPDQGLTECSDGYCRTSCCVDGDGYGDENDYNGLDNYCTYDGEDCKDDNKYVNPDAGEICAGGSDEDCDDLTDCSDPDCFSSDFCISCGSNDDCPSSPCYTSTCVGGSCSVSNFNCGSDDMCCFPYCSIESDPDCEAGCGFVPLGQAVTYTFSPVPSGVGKLAGYGTSSSVKGVGTRSSTDYLGGSITNKLSGILQCNYPHVVRGYAIMDTSCISPDATIASVVFHYKIDTVAGFNHKTIWLDNSDLPDASNDWIINPGNVALPDALMIAAIFPVFSKDVLLNFAIDPDDIQRGRNTRFVFRWGDSSTSDFAIANTLGTCTGAASRSCGTISKCVCRYNGNLAGGGVRPTPCGTDDPCYFKNKLRDECYTASPWNNCGSGDDEHPTWGPVIPKNDEYKCMKQSLFSGGITGNNPSLDITFCNPAYLNLCDSTNGCGDTRTTNPYNRCDLSSDAPCGAETNCADGI